jgi:hypothetical protein
MAPTFEDDAFWLLLGWPFPVGELVDVSEPELVELSDSEIVEGTGATVSG